MTSHAKIAIVDDDPSMCSSLRNLLTALGYAASAFTSAEDFLRAVPTCDADCLLLDVHIGTTTGFAIARDPAVVSLRLPIVFMCGSDEHAVRAQAQALGAPLLRKPFTAPELLAALAKALGPAPP